MVLIRIDGLSLFEYEFSNAGSASPSYEDTDRPPTCPPTAIFVFEIAHSSNSNVVRGNAGIQYRDDHPEP